MAKFRVLHASDFHFSIEPNRRHWFRRISRKFEDCPETPEPTSTRYRGYGFCSYHPSVAQQVAEFAYRNASYLDAIVCSGDLATSGTTEDLTAAKDFIFSVCKTKFVNGRLQPTLQGSMLPILIMPGNHDRYADSDGNSGSANFDLVFDSYWQTEHVPRIQTLELQKQNQKLCFISADFCLKKSSDAAGRPKMFAKRGQGKCYDDVLDNLVKTTNSIKDNDDATFVVWVLHFPPIDEAGEFLKLIDVDKFIKSVNDHNIKLILSGHLHKSINTTIQNSQIHVASTACGVDIVDGNLLHVIEIDLGGTPNPQFKRINFEWTKTGGFDRQQI